MNKNVEQEKYLAYQGAYLATKLRSALGAMLPDPNATELLEELDGLSIYHERLLKVRKYDIDLVSQLKPDSNKIDMLLDAVDTERGIGETIHNKAFEVIFERARDAIESLKNKSI